MRKMSQDGETQSEIVQGGYVTLLQPKYTAVGVYWSLRTLNKWYFSTFLLGFFFKLLNYMCGSTAYLGTI